ncbi:MAG: hypothetical protein ACMXYE_05375 [Candidatus Woesearchaeota archaeon]
MSIDRAIKIIEGTITTAREREPPTQFSGIIEYEGKRHEVMHTGSNPITAMSNAINHVTGKSYAVRYWQHEGFMNECIPEKKQIGTAEVVLADSDGDTYRGRAQGDWSDVCMMQAVVDAYNNRQQQ